MALYEGEGVSSALPDTVGPLPADQSMCNAWPNVFVTTTRHIDVLVNDIWGGEILRVGPLIGTPRHACCHWSRF